MKWFRRLIIRRFRSVGREVVYRYLDGPHIPWTYIWWQNHLWRWLLSRLGPSEVFGLIYAENLWGVEESRSGAGSTLSQTEAMRNTLPALLSQLEVKTLLDLPCGDFHWMSRIKLAGIDYIGADIVPALVASNASQYSGPGRAFIELDLVTSKLPMVDAVLCRDCLVHLPNEMVATALRNICSSGSTWLISTTFPSHLENPDITLGLWRPINLERPPFSLPPPQTLLHEGNPDPRYADKCLGVWRLSDL
jgi:hypothetical protein